MFFRLKSTVPIPTRLRSEACQPWPARHAQPVPSLARRVSVGPGHTWPGFDATVSKERHFSRRSRHEVNAYVPCPRFGSFHFVAASGSTSASPNGLTNRYPCFRMQKDRVASP